MTLGCERPKAPDVRPFSRVASNARRALSALDAGGGAVLEVEDREARLDLMSRDYAALPADVRRRTLVIEPSRAGRDALTHRIRAELVQRGELGSEALNGHRLVRRDMTRAEATDVRSYAAGDILLFNKDYADKGVSRMTAYRVVEIDRDKGHLTLADSADRQVQWHPRRWGSGKVSAFTPADIELRIGDQIAFTRNDRAQGRVNGQQAEVISVHADTQTASVRVASGRIETLHLDRTSDQHITHSYVATAFAAQGRTADRVIISADSADTHLVNQRSFYVAISRAKEVTRVYTDDRARLVHAVQERAGLKQTALLAGRPAITPAERSAASVLGL